MGDPAWKVICDDEDFKAEKYVWAVPELLEMLAQPWYLDRLSVLHAVRRLGPIAKDAIPLLRKCLDDTEASIRVTAASVLKDVDGISMRVLEVLEKEVTGSESAMAVCHMSFVAEKLAAGSHGTDDPSGTAMLLPVVLRILSAMCENRLDYYSRLVGAQSLGYLGARAQSVLPVLTLLLSDEDEGIQKAAREAICRIKESADGSSSAP